MADNDDGEHRLNYAGVRAYWDNAAQQAASASYMAHEQGLPHSCVTHRFALEQAVIDRWFAGLDSTASVLDVGCGAGAWTKLFAQRYRRVVGVEASSGMFAAAQEHLAEFDNVELVHGDAVSVALDGRFDGILLGGLLMYLNRADAVALLQRLRGRLAPGGRIVLRESGIRVGVEIHADTYPVAYRSVPQYRTLAGEAGLQVTAVERNRGYAHMEVAVCLVDAVRRWPPLARRDPTAVGRPLWRALRATTPITLDLIPRIIEKAGIDWPHLTNHFLLLEPQRRPDG